MLLKSITPTLNECKILNHKNSKYVSGKIKQNISDATVILGKPDLKERKIAKKKVHFIILFKVSIYQEDIQL